MPGCLSAACRTLFISALVLFMTACSVVPIQDSPQPDNWQHTHQHHLQLKHWQISARMAVQTSIQGGSVDVFWKQQGDSFEIRLLAPFGQGAMQLKGNAQWVHATFANGQQLQGKPAELMQQHFDISVPVASLVYWLRGVAAAGDYSTARWNEQGQLYKLQQQGWQVEMYQYQLLGEYALPHKFYLEDISNPENTVRLIIRRWQIAAS